MVFVSLTCSKFKLARANQSREGNYEWHEFPNLEPADAENYNSRNHPRTRPKPDLTYAFSILQGPLESMSVFERDDFGKSFTIQSLGELSKKGVICAPTTGLRKWTSSPNTHLSSTEVACFPWAVVEFKKYIQKSAERCYCQAANASSVALVLQAQLSAKANENANENAKEKAMHAACSKLPPIVSFTCVGPIVKVWLTYYKYSSSARKFERVRALLFLILLFIANGCSLWHASGALRCN
jgi:hypothetical protein